MYRKACIDRSPGDNSFSGIFEYVFFSGEHFFPIWLVDVSSKMFVE